MNDRNSRDSRSHDFDFFFGEWRVHHRRLKARLENCDDWEEFAGTCRTQPLLDGYGNLDDNTLELPGDAYRAATLRAFDPRTGTWAIWWLDGRKPHRLDLPMVRGFADGVGAFLAAKSPAGRAVKAPFL